MAAEKVRLIRCMECGLRLHTARVEDAEAYVHYMNAMGADHSGVGCPDRLQVCGEADPAELGRHSRKLWPLELAAARLFGDAFARGTGEAFARGTGTTGLDGMLELVLGKHMLRDARDRLIKIAWNLGREFAKKPPERNWRRKYHVEARHA